MFASVPLNLLGDKTTADYLVTGNWSAKAASEVKITMWRMLLLQLTCTRYHFIHSRRKSTAPQTSWLTQRKMASRRFPSGIPGRPTRKRLTSTIVIMRLSMVSFKHCHMYLTKKALILVRWLGVEFPADYFAKAENKVDVPIVVDMSSNFFSRPVDVSQYAVIYGTCLTSYTYP